MPNLFNRLMPRGTTFTDYVVTTPLCCPSRATILTGQYGHNNGVLRNFYPDLKQQQNVLPAWLQRAGYNTAHVGKFLNAYESNEGGAVRGRARLGPLVHRAREAPLLQLEGVEERQGPPLRHQRRRPRDRR